MSDYRVKSVDETMAIRICTEEQDKRMYHDALSATAVYYRNSMPTSDSTSGVCEELGSRIAGVHYSGLFTGVCFAALSAFDTIAQKVPATIREIQYHMHSKQLVINQWFVACPKADRVARTPFHTVDHLQAVDVAATNKIIDRIPRLHASDRPLLLRVVRMMLSIDETQPDVVFGFLNNGGGGGGNGGGDSDLDQCYALTFANLTSITYSFVCTLAANTDGRLQDVFADYADDQQQTRVIVFIRRRNGTLYRQPPPPVVMHAMQRYERVRFEMRTAAATSKSSPSDDDDESSSDDDDGGGSFVGRTVQAAPGGGRKRSRDER